MGSSYIAHVPQENNDQTAKSITKNKNLELRISKLSLPSVSSVSLYIEFSYGLR